VELTARRGGQLGDKRVLPNGLAVTGASRTEERLYQLIRDYFDGIVQVSPGCTVFDVGANIGLFSLEVLQRCQGDVQLYAFEPAPDSFAHLQNNLSEHFPQVPVHLSQSAVAAAPGTATFYHRPRASGLSSLVPGSVTDTEALAQAMLRADPPAGYEGAVPQWFRRLPHGLSKPLLRWAMKMGESKVTEFPCKVTTISEVMREQGVERIDYLKIDVEGAELDVLNGIQDSDWPKIQAVAMEVHDIDNRVAAVQDLLTRQGFQTIQAGQEWLFTGTNVYMVAATRG
jgi:FkbM family methyltransferase